MPGYSFIGCGMAMCELPNRIIRYLTEESLRDPGITDLETRIKYMHHRFEQIVERPQGFHEIGLAAKWAKHYGEYREAVA